eukprot:749883-Hanusia_phi.AAC.8
MMCSYKFIAPLTDSRTYGPPQTAEGQPGQRFYGEWLSLAHSITEAPGPGSDARSPISPVPFLVE